MKKFFALAVISGILAVGNSAEAGIIKFDDITTEAFKSLSWDSSSDPCKKEYEYGGFIWRNFGVINGEAKGYPGYKNGTVSGDYTAFPVRYPVAGGFKGDLSLSTADGSTFDFISAYFSAAFRDDLKIDVTGFTKSSVSYTHSFTINPLRPIKISFNFTDIDSLLFVAYGGETKAGYGGDGPHFAMDNFTFTEPVPIPATVLLFGTGMAGLFAVRRKTRRELP